MTIVRYRPWSEVNSLYNKLNRIFDEALAPVNSVNEFGNDTNFPAAELIETNDTLILKLELPGTKLANLNIEATVNSISISGERKLETQENEVPIKSEFRYHTFQRVISLPVKIQNTEIKTEYRNGILYLTLPKAIKKANKVVKVNLT